MPSGFGILQNNCMLTERGQKITPGEKVDTRRLERKTIFSLSPRRVSPFLAWDDFHARSRFARSIIPEEKWGTTHSLLVKRSSCIFLTNRKLA